MSAIEFRKIINQEKLLHESIDKFIDGVLVGSSKNLYPIPEIIYITFEEIKAEFKYKITLELFGESFSYAFMDKIIDLLPNEIANQVLIMLEKGTEVRNFTNDIKNMFNDILLLMDISPENTIIYLEKMGSIQGHFIRIFFDMINDILPFIKSKLREKGILK